MYVDQQPLLLPEKHFFHQANHPSICTDENDIQIHATTIASFANTMPLRTA